MKIDKESLLLWNKFNYYMFDEKAHKYYYYEKPVQTSVTQFINRFFEPFDREGISYQYAKKHGLSQQQVLADWDKKAKVSSLSGTIIHSFMENSARGKCLELDYRDADRSGFRKDIQERVNILLPQAIKFQEETYGKLLPIQMEYTVGLEDYIAGNIDLLCWNNKANELQIWDYKNLKELTTKSKYNKKALGVFSKYDDCHLVHYSIQLNVYKVILQRVLGVSVGKCYLVHFCPTASDYKVYECLDLQQECNEALDELTAKKETSEVIIKE